MRDEIEALLASNDRLASLLEAALDVVETSQQVLGQFHPIAAPRVRENCAPSMLPLFDALARFDAEANR